jgi:hypothetical protein
MLELSTSDVVVFNDGVTLHLDRSYFFTPVVGIVTKKQEILRLI